MSAETSRDLFKLLPAAETDIPRLSQIHVDACGSDPCIRLKFPVWTEFEPRVSDMLHSQIGKPVWKHVKAVDEQTNMLAGWASWITVEANKNEGEATEESQQSSSTSESSGRPLTEAGHEEGEAENTEQFRFLPGLGVCVNQTTEQALDQFTSGRRHIRCKALFVDPAFQQRGMASALVRHGNELADQVGLPILLHGTPSGQRIYRACGFQELGKLDIDLQSWTKNPESGVRLGRYTIRYMKREPLARSIDS